MRIEHHHVASANERTKEHEKILTALPRKSLGCYRKHIRMQRSKCSQALCKTATLDFPTRDQLDQRVGILRSQFVACLGWVATEDQQDDLQASTPIAIAICLATKHH
jgi:hypothetical protein